MNRAQSVRARASARRGPNRLPRGYAGTLLAMFYGLAIAVLVVGAGVGALVTEGIKADTATAGSGADAKQGEQRPAASPAASPAQISITATHLGELRVGIVSPPDIAINFRKAREIGMKVPFSFFESASYIYDYEGRSVRSAGGVPGG